ncbi:ankyrin repeat domain-containing protein 37 isoform X2 [Piliocolobus tephrosceles]|nr:ankyrin repeat domain-containing protein 37 isoform X2 [Piliocolobus tephrosceles]
MKELAFPGAEAAAAPCTAASERGVDGELRAAPCFLVTCAPAEPKPAAETPASPEGLKGGTTTGRRVKLSAPHGGRGTPPARVPVRPRPLTYPAQVDGLKHLLETGASVNAPPDPCEQSPVHLAAGSGLACFLLWQLQTGADLNQQDVFGEAPLHKAAKVGSLECLSLLVASDAQIDLCNKNGQTAEDLAWSCGFPDCAKFLTTIKCMQTIQAGGHSHRNDCVPVLRQKRSFGSVESTSGKRKC